MAAKGSLSRNLITGGCSFTAHKTRETLAWAEQLSEKYDNVINTAEMASGNQIICDRICYELSKPEVTSDNTAVAIMWSSPFRKEFLFTYDDPDYTDIWQRFKDKIGFSNYILTDKQHEKHSTSNWLIVGGGYGIWNYEVTPLDDRLKNYFSDIFNPEEAYVSTLRAMITVQSLCQAKKIPLLNMCWQNLFHDLGSRDFESEQSFWKKDIVSTTGWLYTRLRTAFSNRLRDKGLLNEQEMKSDMHNKRIDRLYPNTKHWFELIDWGTWHFYENELIQKGGLQEFAHFECKVKSEDLKNHPSTETQSEWRKIIMKELEERYGVEEI